MARMSRLLPGPDNGRDLISFPSQDGQEFRLAPYTLSSVPVPLSGSHWRKSGGGLLISCHPVVRMKGNQAFEEKHSRRQVCPEQLFPFLLILSLALRLPNTGGGHSPLRSSGSGNQGCWWGRPSVRKHWWDPMLSNQT